MTEFKQEYLFTFPFSLTIGTMLEIDWSDEHEDMFVTPKIYIVIGISGPLVYHHSPLFNNEETRKQSTYVDLFDQITQRTRTETMSQLEYWYHNNALRIIHRP